METLSKSLILFWLGSCGASAKRLNAALEIFDANEIYESIEHEQFKNAFGEQAHNNLISSKKEAKLTERLEKLAKKGIKVVTRENQYFPQRLKQKEVNPPLFLYYKGDISLLPTDAIAVVGTRKSTRYGKEATEKLVRELVTCGGLTIISGLAEGIDAYAHTETLNNGGKTIAVLGGGFDHIYPNINAPLCQRIVAEGGLVVTEYPCDLKPAKYTFPERNRIISGLSVGVLITEADKKSGSMITANFALEQGREVYAVPGNITSPRSEGTNELILNGATIVLSAKQIFENLKMSVPGVQMSMEILLDSAEQTLYELLKDEAMSFDELLVKSNISFGELSALLTKMEIKGVIKKLPSNFYSR